MRESPALSEAFAAAHPLEAAQVLERLPAAQTAAYLSQLPARVAAGVVKRMAPPYSARCAEALDEPTLMALAEMLGPQPTAALLTHLPPDRQAKTLERLPVAVAVAARLLIGYPPETAGAWMEPWPLGLAADMPAEDAAAELKRFDGALHDVVFVVEGEWRLVGMVTAGALLRAQPREPLSHIMRKPAPCVPALAPVASLRATAAWDELPALAVVERGNRLVGALTRVALARALAAARPQPVSQMAGETLTALGSAYWQSVAALAQLAVTLLPAVAPVGAKEDRNER